ncbi:peptidyl-tRNA hydrolase [Candidatus Woesearchaeota archaeon]|nr:peptidyl-tRNA hydrolase [Candidatus Woesearchaeota archaeon]
MKNFNYKLVILVRENLKMSKGKIAVQCGHACVDAVFNSDRKIIDEWRKEGMKKVVLKVKDLKELMKFKELAGKNDLKVSLIKDAGLTEFEKPEITCLGIGPDKEEKIDKITGELETL